MSVESPRICRKRECGLRGPRLPGFTENWGCCQADTCPTCPKIMPHLQGVMLAADTREEEKPLPSLMTRPCGNESCFFWQGNRPGYDGLHGYCQAETPAECPKNRAEGTLLTMNTVNAPETPQRAP